MKRLLGCLLGALVLLNAVPASGVEPEIPADERVRLLLELTGAEQIGLQMMDAMMTDFEDGFPTVPSEFWKEFRAEMKPGEIVTLLVPVYQKHFSREDIEELIQFFSSSSGRRFVSIQPAILADSMEVGRQWGLQLAERALERMKSRGLLN